MDLKKREGTMPVDPMSHLTPIVAGAVDAGDKVQLKCQGTPSVTTGSWAHLSSAVWNVGAAIKHLANIGGALGRKADNQTVALDMLSARVDSLSVNVATLVSLVRKLEASTPATIAQQSTAPRPNALRGTENRAGPPLPR